MAIRIITDSSADFDSAVAKRRNIDVVPMSIQFGDASFLAGRTLSNEVFYKLLQEKKENPTTSQPTPEAFLRLFQEAREAGDQVVAVVLSGALSGTLQSAVIAKELCQYEPSIWWTAAAPAPAFRSWSTTPASCAAAAWGRRTSPGSWSG